MFLLLCVCVLQSFIFIYHQVSFIVRDNEVSVVRERESKTCSQLQQRTVLFARWQWLLVPTFQSDVLFSSHLYFHHWLLINLNFSEAWSESTNLLPWSSELQVLGIWRRSSELLVFRVFGTWSSESSSPQKLETFIRTLGLQKVRVVPGRKLWF